MAKVRIRKDAEGRENGYVEIKCPGCDETHSLNISPGSGRPACWGFNGDIEKPTFTPSLLVRSGHHVPGTPQPPNCPQCNYVDDDGKPWPWGCGVCHSFIRNGQIEFLGDCTHALAGKTVPLPDIE